jgi:molecular chaperone GrpE (heat shock protein)
MEEQDYKLLLHRNQEEFAAYRERSKLELIEAINRGRDEATLLLVDLVDDCDRALDIIDNDRSQDSKIKDGVIQLRDRALRRFAEVGLFPFAETGDFFDPQKHNAIATEDGDGSDGTIVKIHQRGWRREDGSVVRTAMVTVLQKDSIKYQCPFHTPGCQGDCPECLLEGVS